MSFQITIRYGRQHHRYHTLTADTDDIRVALRQAADALPDEVAAVTDLVEIRPAVDPDARSYLGEDE